MKKNLFLKIFLVLLFFSCSNPITTDTGGEPVLPRWVELSVNIDSLPAEKKTGSLQFQFIVTGDGDKMPVAFETKDTVNYIRISFHPDPGQQRTTIIKGDSLWEGNISFLDTISLKTQFLPMKTTYVYSSHNGEYREFDWAVNILVGYYIEDKGSLVGYGGNPDPSMPLNNPTYATLNINTKTGDTYLKIHAVTN
ncbi:MAG: hypothetical protein GY936_01065 [Ignavibacteriae bacterium]|nr:hypothetical protein [Ignavibacteriota bacterium]